MLEWLLSSNFQRRCRDDNYDGYKLFYNAESVKMKLIKRVCLRYVVK